MYLYTVKTNDANIFIFNTFYGALVFLRRFIHEYCDKRTEGCRGCPFDKIPIKSYNHYDKYSDNYFNHYMDRLCKIQSDSYFNHRKEIKLLKILCKKLGFEFFINKKSNF